MLTPAIQLPQLCEQINQHVQTVCCIGAHNLGSARLATIELYKYTKALYFTFYKPTLACTKRLAIKENEKAIYESTIKDGRVGPFRLNEGYGVFNFGDEMLSLPVETFISKDVILFVNRVFPLQEKFKFTDYTVEDYLPYLGQLLLKETIAKRATAGFTAEMVQELAEEQLFNGIFEKGDEFTGENKDLFLHKTFKDVRNACFYFGIGNCGLMADAAFAQAIALEHSHPVTYLRFVCKDDPNADILNCVALGNWPDPGCIIIAPWLKKDCFFMWNGTIENTPRVTQVLSKFDTCRVLCRLSPEEKALAKEELNKMGYGQWLTSETRNNNLSKIRESAENFLQNIYEVIGAPKATLKLP